MARYKLTAQGVLDTDTDTGAAIPEAIGNRHWAEYQAWRKDGNEPDPVAAPPTPPSAAQRQSCAP